MLYVLAGGCVFIALALVADAKGTVNAVTIILTVRGVTFICKKMTQTLNRDAADIINFAGWGIAGISIVKLIRLAINGFSPVADFFIQITDSISKVSDSINKAGEFIEKIAG